jgi:hypothetical protein
VIATSNRALALEFDGIRFEVDPEVGGRITSFSLDGFDILAGPDVDANSYGSTFWTSPQSDWGWPPPAEVDRAPYSVVDQGDTLTLAGAPNRALGVRVTKQFSIDRVRGAIVLRYTIVNDGDAHKRYAPWEVSRVHARGLTFFSTGTTPTMPDSSPRSGIRAPSSALGRLHVERCSGGTWFAHDPDVLDSTGQKAFAHAAQGFLAHAARGLLYVKSFAEVPSELQAPGEAEIEIYANNRYVEVELQGPYTVIAPGDSVTWSIRWYLRKLPPHVALLPGNSELVALASAVVRSGAARPAPVTRPHSLG